MTGWQSVRLGDICQIYDGPHATPPKQDSGVVFIGISSLDYSGRLNPTYFEYVSEEYYTKWTKRVVPTPNDVVFSYETKLGVAGIIPPWLKCCLGRRMGLLRANEKVIPRFLLYAYLSPDFQNLIKEKTNYGSTVDRIALKELPDFYIKIPDLKIQHEILSLLAPIDDKIDLLHRQNITLEAMAEALFRQWFVVEAKEEWHDGTIDDLFTLQRGFDLPATNREDGRFPVISASGYHGRHSEAKVKAPGVVTGRSGVVGSVFYIQDDFWPLNTTLWIKEFKKATPLFSFELLKMLNLSVMNAGSAVPTLNRNHVHSLPQLIPQSDIIDAYENIASRLYAKVYSNNSQIKTLEKIRNILLPKLMSGEVRMEH